MIIKLLALVGLYVLWKMFEALVGTNSALFCLCIVVTIFLVFWSLSDD